MKNRYILLSFIFLFASCNFDGIKSSEHSFNSEYLSSNTLLTDDNSSFNEYDPLSYSVDRTELNEKIDICKYLGYHYIGKNSNKTISYFDGPITNIIDYDLPDFCLAGDSLVMKYYGKINYVYDTHGLCDTFLNGEVVDVEYIKAEVKQIEFNVGYYENGDKYFEIKGEKFDFFIVDKNYNIRSVDEYNYEALYASYYNKIPYALYSFNPLV